MLKRDLAMSLAALALLVVSLAQAPLVPRSLRAGSVASAFQDQHKTTLGETSIGVPSLWTNNPASGEQAAAPGAVLEWTGTDDLHRLNILTSDDGITFGHRVTLDELSIARPAVAVVNGGKVALAWTGTDNNHSLNVLVDPYAVTPQKLTLWAENSFTAPALAYLNGHLWPSWTGTDANHSLNVLPITIEPTAAVDELPLCNLMETVAGQFSVEECTGRLARGESFQPRRWWTMHGRAP